MSEEIPPTEDFESQLFPDGEQLFRQIISRDPQFWDLYAIPHSERVLGERLSGHINNRTITGTSESGATIQIKDSDNIVLYEKPGSDSKEVVQFKKGISIAVTPPHKAGEPSTTVELFIPDNPEEHSEVQPMHAVTFSETGGAEFKIVPAVDPVPEDAGKFDEAISEIKYWLGDKVIWDSQESQAIPPPKSEHPFDFMDL